MTFAPPALKALAAYWVEHGGVNLGVVGDQRHAAMGTSYHLGRSQLLPNAYSARTLRDRLGLTEAASAIDLGKLDGGFPKLRTFSAWLVDQARARKPGTQDIREIIFSPDGHKVVGWNREAGVTSALIPGYGDRTHLTHTHVSFYRDSEKRDKVGLFRPFFAGVPVTPPTDADAETVWGPDVPAAIRALDPPGRSVMIRVRQTGHDPKGLVGMGDLAEAMRRAGIDFGGVPDPPDVRNLLKWRRPPAKKKK